MLNIKNFTYETQDNKLLFVRMLHRAIQIQPYYLKYIMSKNEIITFYSKNL